MSPRGQFLDLVPPRALGGVLRDRRRTDWVIRVSLGRHAAGGDGRHLRAARDAVNEAGGRVGFLHVGCGPRDRANQGNDAPGAETRAGGSAEGASHRGRPNSAAPEGATPVFGCADQRGAGAGNQHPERGPAPGMRPYDHQSPRVARGTGGAAAPRAPVGAGETPSGRGPGHRAGPLAGVVRPSDRWRAVAGRARRAEGAAGSRHGDATLRAGAPETVPGSPDGRGNAPRGTV